MRWRSFALSATACFCFFPDLLRAQDADKPADEKAADDAAKPTEEAVKPTDEAAKAAEPIPDAIKSEPAPSGAKGIFGDLRFGPSVAVGFPHPITGGVDLVYSDFISLSVTGGRYGADVEDTEVEIRNWDVAVRWYPFGGSFFLGAAHGEQGIVGKTKVDLKVNSGGVELTVPTTIRLEVEASYLTPQIGWFARWDSGFTLGFDFGWQMPSMVRSELQTSFENVSTASESAVRDSAEYKKNKKDVEDVAENFGKKAIPYITLLRLGWLF